MSNVLVFNFPKAARRTVGDRLLAKAAPALDPRSVQPGHLQLNGLGYGSQSVPAGRAATMPTQYQGLGDSPAVRAAMTRSDPYAKHRAQVALAQEARAQVRVQQAQSSSAGATAAPAGRTAPAMMQLRLGQLVVLDGKIYRVARGLLGVTLTSVR